jgi:hypothetical protein
MNKGMLAQQGAGYKIILTMAISITVGYMAVLVGQSVAGAIWHFDLVDPQAEYDLSDPDYAMARRVVMLFTHLGMFVASAFIGAWLFTRGSVQTELGLRPKPRVMHLLLVPVLMAAVFPVVNYLYALNLQWNAPDTVMDLEEQGMAMTDSFLDTGSVGMLLLNLLVLAAVPAMGEELIFRGLVQRYAIRWLRNPHAGIWVSAFLFSFMHFQFLGFMPRLALGAFFGYLAWWTGSLWAGMMLHFLNNALAVVLAFMIRNYHVPAWVDDAGSDSPAMAAAGLVVTALISWLLWRSRKPSATGPESGAVRSHGQ